MNEAETEKMIQEKGKTAPRITPEMVDDQIASITYWLPGRDQVTGALADTDSPEIKALACLTVCAIGLKNGFVVTGESACASLDNYDFEIGRKIAFANARQKIWALEGYLLRTKLATNP